MAERRLGDRIMRSLMRDPDVIDDPLVLEYVSQIWARLLRVREAKSAPSWKPRTPGSPSWSATSRSTPLPCPAATSACTWACWP